MPAATYLRSSKDRHDASIQSQRRELQKLAERKNLKIIQEYSDVVESAKDENRPGFQQLLADLKSPARAWDTLLMVDTSRLSRRRFIAQVFKHEAQKRGVAIIYSKLPEMDPITAVIVESTLEAMDEVHSLMSKEKGLAGMRENILQGYRAGGRAPLGYRLEKIETGAIREGRPVTKTVLAKTKDAVRIRKYLKARARGTPRSQAAAGLRLAQSSLNGIDWNALTYAGHTVWNQLNEYEPGGYRGGRKRRPREEWVIRENTHPALITTDEAERILAILEDRSNGPRQTTARHLLTGLLVTPDGTRWYGDRGIYYRLKSGKGKRIKAGEIEQAIIERIMTDWSSDEFADMIIKLTKQKGKEKNPAADLRAQVHAINDQISKTMDLAAEMTSKRPALDKIEELEQSRAILEAEIKDIETEYAASQALKNITRDQVKSILADYAGDLDLMDRDKLKDFLQQNIDKITLDPTENTCHIHYKIPISGTKVASPRQSPASATFLRLDAKIAV